MIVPPRCETRHGAGRRLPLLGRRFRAGRKVLGKACSHKSNCGPHLLARRARRAEPLGGSRPLSADQRALIVLRRLPDASRGAARTVALVASPILDASGSIHARIHWWRQEASCPGRDRGPPSADIPLVRLTLLSTAFVVGSHGRLSLAFCVLRFASASPALPPEAVDRGINRRLMVASGPCWRSSGICRICRAGRARCFRRARRVRRASCAVDLLTTAEVAGAELLS
eukprot:scaffold47222_cov72-Phaeocystis_antarctica.AAC.10